MMEAMTNTPNDKGPRRWWKIDGYVEMNFYRTKERDDMVSWVSGNDYDALEKALAVEKRKVEMLRVQRNIENGDKWNARGFGTMAGVKEIVELDARIEAIEKESET